MVSKSASFLADFLSPKRVKNSTTFVTGDLYKIAIVITRKLQRPLLKKNKKDFVTSGKGPIFLNS